jgi:rhodanese-related sulfurtransferase
MKFNVKPPFFLFIVLFTGFLSAAELVTISSEQLQTMQQQNALVIDIRTQQEWAETGTIPESLKIQFFDKNGNYDSEQWLKQLNERRQSLNQPVILVCRSGNRSAKVGNFLTQKLGMNNIYHLENGMNAWTKEAREIDKECPTQIACKK